MGSLESTFHKCKVNTAHQIELLVIGISKRWRGRIQGQRVECGDGLGAGGTQ